MTDWRQVAYQSAVRAGHPDPGMFVRQMLAESGLRPGLTSSAGAQGIAQIMPATAQSWGVNPHDPVASLNAAAKAMTKYLRSYNGNAAMALAAYNAGPGAVQKYNGVPPYAETRSYIKKILSGHTPTGQAPAGPQRGSQAPQTRPQGDPIALSNQINRIQNAYVDSPDLAKPHVDKLMAGFQGGLSNPTYQNPSGPSSIGSAGGGMFRTPNGNVRNQLPGESHLDFMLRLGKVGFGLVNDPGNHQTTGGSHEAGSLHYDGRAVDWGNARNPASRLQAFYDWAKPRAATLGTEELIWQAPGHYDHLHWGRSATPPPSIRPSNSRRRPVKRVRTAQ